MFNDCDIWQVTDQVRFRRLFDEGVLIHQEQANALVLNDTAIAFLEQCDGQRNAGQIIIDLCEIYDVESDVLKKDIGLFVKELAGLGIIQSSNSK